MRAQLRRIGNVIVRPEEEWARIARDAESPFVLLVRVLAPLALIPPLASAFRVVHAGEAAVAAALLSALVAFGSAIAGAAVVAATIWLVAPLYRAPRDYAAAFRAVTYAAAPVCLSGVILAAPLQRFGLLIVIVLVGLIHALYLLYVGLHHVVKVARSDAAECAAVVVLVSFFFSTILGYYAAAAS